MKKILRRIGAVLLTLSMIATMLPVFTLPAAAAGNLAVSDPNIGLSWTDASNSSGAANWSASGTTITGTATGYSYNIIIGTYPKSITTKLVITNKNADTRTLSFNYTLAGGGSVSGISGNAYSGELAAGASLTITLTSPSGPSSNTLKISNIKLVGNSNVTATFLPGENGSYTVNGTRVTTQVSYEKAPDQSSYALVATPNSGYALYGWYNETIGAYVSYDASATLSIDNHSTIKPVFVSGDPAHFGVGTKRFYDLDEAIQEAQSGSDKKIVVLKNGTVTGSHTIPAGVTLLVPYNATSSAHGSSPSCTSYTVGAVNAALGQTGSVAWVKPTKYRELTLAADAHITVNGAIEVGGQHASAAGGTPFNGRYGGSPTGPLGFIHMQAGSHIDINSGANLYCWGYIYGDGTITAKNGSSIYENFQIMDFRGGNKSTALAEGFLVFPTSQYYVQNIEVATKYEYGSIEYVHTSVYMQGTESGATIPFIGEGGMFHPEPGSYVVKDYDPTTDNLILESYGDCALASLQMSIAGVSVNAEKFVLPITNNIQIYIKSGTATLKQNIMMLPGSSLTVDQGATVNIAYTAPTDDDLVVTCGGYVVQLFSYNNYTYGIDTDTFEVVSDRYYSHFDKSMKMRSRPVEFTCTTHYKRTEADLKDAKLDINGTVITNGYIYSTVDYASVLDEDYTITGGGANVISSEGTGYIQMVNGAGEDFFGMLYDQDCTIVGEDEGDGIYYYIPLASVQLRNEDGTLLDTTGAAAGAVYVYCKECDCWYATACCTHNGHDFDSDTDAACNVCGALRLYNTRGSSAMEMSEDRGGLAVLFTVNIADVAKDGYIGDLTNAKIVTDDAELTVLRIGAVVSNNGTMPDLDHLDTVTSRVIDIEAEKLYETTENTASFAIRIVNIPKSGFSTSILYRPYCIYLDADGNQVIYYGDAVQKSYDDLVS